MAQMERNVAEKLITRSRTAREASTECVKGKPKSGRTWKGSSKRFSQLLINRPLRSTWDVKMRERQEKKVLKNLSKQLKDEKQQERQEKKRRREENLRRRLENERKAEIVQMIRNPAKLKHASKKQLRRVEKRDTLMILKTGEKSSQNGTVAPIK